MTAGTGYTGEDGLEIQCSFAQLALMRSFNRSAGLGTRAIPRSRVYLSMEMNFSTINFVHKPT